MSYEKTKLMNLEDGQTLLGAIDGKMSDLKSALYSGIGNIANSATVVSGLYIDTSGVLTALASGSADRTICIKAEPNRSYIVNKPTATIMRVGCGASDDLIAGTSLNSYSGHSSASADSLFVKTTETEDYIYIQLYADSDIADLKSISANTAFLIVIENQSDAIEKINRIYDKPVKTDVIDFDTIPYKAVFINTSNIWKRQGSVKTYFIPVDPTVQLSVHVVASATRNAYVAMLKNDTAAMDTAVEYATGGKNNIIAAGTEQTLDIPFDCYCIGVRWYYNDISYKPQSVVVNTNINIIDKTLTIEGESADAKATGDRIRNIYGAFTTNENIDFESATTRKGIISVNNLWSTSSGFYSYAFSIDDSYFQMTVEAGEKKAFIGLLKNSDLHNNQTPPYCDGITNRLVVAEGETQEFIIPSDCTYIVIMKEASNVDYTPETVMFHKWNINHGSESNPLGLHELPQSESALNIVKRCRQMTDIKWTPAVDLKRFMLVQRGGVATPDTASGQNYLGTFKAGVEYTGVPYGRVFMTMNEHGYNYATVGHYIDFETFVSSVSNPKSALSEIDVSSVSGHRSVLYATVCSGLTCYALDVSEVPTANIANISGLNLVGKINSNGTLLPDSSFCIGDVLNKANDHTAIITDIIRDNEGVIQFVELSDASTAGLADRNYDDGQIGGLCRRKGWTREQIFDANSWGAYSVYRYSKNVPYTPSKYVNIGDEFNMQRIEHFPIMPYEGEGFIFKTGYIPNNAVKLVITLDGYSLVRVFKDGTEISGSPFTVSTGEDNDINPINVTEIGAGSYTAYLCNMSDGNVTNLTYACHWTVE